MKHPIHLMLVGLFVLPMAWGKPRTFANKEGRTVEAELVALEGAEVVMKLTNRKIAKVPLDSLSEQDQTYVKAWWEKNKNKLNSMDVKLTLDRNTKQLDRSLNRSGGNGGNNRNKSVMVKRMSKTEIHYVGELKSFAQKEVEDIEVKWVIHKRVSTRDEEGSETKTEEIEGDTTIRRLEAFGTVTFETDPIECEDSSQSGGGKPRLSNRETIVGMVVTLSAGGEVFLEQSHPENFLDKLKEEEEREEEREERQGL